MNKVISITFEIHTDGKRTYVEKRSFTESHFLGQAQSGIYSEIQAMVNATVREVCTPARPKEGSNN